MSERGCCTQLQKIENVHPIGIYVNMYQCLDMIVKCKICAMQIQKVKLNVFSILPSSNFSKRRVICPYHEKLRKFRSFYKLAVEYIHSCANWKWKINGFFWKIEQFPFLVLSYIALLFLQQLPTQIKTSFSLTNIEWKKVQQIIIRNNQIRKEPNHKKNYKLQSKIASKKIC